MTEAQAPGTRPGRSALIAFVAVILLGGTNAVAAKELVKDLDPLWGAALRFMAAGLILFVIAGLTNRSFPRGRSLIGALAYGLLGFTISYGLMFTALSEVPAGTAMVLLALTPLFTFGLAIAHRQERFHVQGLLGALIAVAGVAIVFVDQLSADVRLVPMVLILVATLSIAESGVIVKWIPRSDPFSTNAVAMFIGGLLLLVASLILGETLAFPVAQVTWVALGYLIVLGSVVMFALFVFTIQRWTASAVSYVTLLMPVVTVAFATAFTGERFTLSFAVGSLVILGGVYVGAFLSRRPVRSSASSAPECLPIDACADAEPASAGIQRASDS
jgi:drug/metabolite transporter (DMT)-like permease